MQEAPLTKAITSSDWTLPFTTGRTYRWGISYTASPRQLNQHAIAKNLGLETELHRKHHQLSPGRTTKEKNVSKMAALPVPPERLRYWLAHPNENSGPGLIAVSVITLTLSIAFVALRFWSRHVTGARVGADDWTSVAAVVSSLRLQVLRLVSPSLMSVPRLALPSSSA